MAVSNTTPRIFYTGNGNTTDYSFSFEIMNATDLEVRTDAYQNQLGTTATATASIAAGAVTGFTIGAGGTAYTTEPTVVLSGGGGSGATATCTISNGAVNSITVTAGGSGYTTSPTVTFTGGGFAFEVIGTTEDTASTGTVRFRTAPTNLQPIAIQSNRSPERTTDFTDGAALSAPTLNREFDNLNIASRDNKGIRQQTIQVDKTDADSFHANGDVKANLTLPNKTTRASKYLGFDSDGNVTALGIIASANDLSDVDTTGVADGKILKYSGASSKFVVADDNDFDNTDFDNRLATKDTGDLSEGSNLYFTNARVDSRITSDWLIDEDNMSTNSATKLPSQQSVKAYVDSQVASKDNTDEITEGSTNLYFTNARADARVNLQTGANLDLSSKTTAHLTEGSNLYYTDTRANSAFDTRLATKSTSDLSEGTNLYHTNARADARIAAADIDALNNVITSGITNGQALVWSTANSRFEPGDAGVSYTWANDVDANGNDLSNVKDLTIHSTGKLDMNYRDIENVNEITFIESGGTRGAIHDLTNLNFKGDQSGNHIYGDSTVSANGDLFFVSQYGIMDFKATNNTDGNSGINGQINLHADSNVNLFARPNSYQSDPDADGAIGLTAGQIADSDTNAITLTAHRIKFVGGFGKTNETGIDDVTITSVGSGYNNSGGQPTVSFSGGGGSGAAATAVVNSSGQVTRVDITNPGSGYTSLPTVAFTGGAGSGATGTAVMNKSNVFRLSGDMGTAGQVLTLSGTTDKVASWSSLPTQSTIGNYTFSGNTMNATGDMLLNPQGDSALGFVKIQGVALEANTITSNAEALTDHNRLVIKEGQLDEAFTFTSNVGSQYNTTLKLNTVAGNLKQVIETDSGLRIKTSANDLELQPAGSANVTVNQGHLVVSDSGISGPNDTDIKINPEGTGKINLERGEITTSSNADITLDPHGTGKIRIGDDVDIVSNSNKDIVLAPGGSGQVKIDDINVGGGEIDNTVIGANQAVAGTFTNLTGSGTISLNSLTYPSSDGTANQALLTNGSGTLSFGTVATVSNNTNNRVLTATGGADVNGEANLTFDGTDLVVGSTGGRITVDNITVNSGIGAGNLALTTPLSVANGGTGATTFADNKLIVGDDASNLQAKTELDFDGTRLKVIDLAIETSKIKISDGNTTTIKTSVANDHLIIKPDQTGATGNYGAQGEWGWGGGVTHINGPLSINPTDTPDIGELYNQGIQVTGTHDSWPALVLASKSDSGKFGNVWFLRSEGDGTDARVSDGATLGGFYASGFAASGSGQNYNTVSSSCFFKAAGDHSDSNSGGFFQVRATSEDDTSLRTVTNFQGNRAHFNPDNQNIDFRVDGDSNDNLLFVDAQTEQVIIGAGSTDDITFDTKFAIEGNGSEHPCLRIDSNATNKTAELHLVNPTGAGASSGASIAFAEGTTRQTYMHHSFNSGYWQITTTGGEVFRINEGSTVATGDFNDTSDRGLKENIADISDATSIVKQLQPRTFDWKGEKADRGGSAGFIAQEVKAILPDLVDGEEYDETKPLEERTKLSIRTHGIVSYLTKALQESIEKIESLEARIKTLEDNQ